MSTNVSVPPSRAPVARGAQPRRRASPAAPRLHAISGYGDRAPGEAL